MDDGTLFGTAEAPGEYPDDAPRYTFTGFDAVPPTGANHPDTARHAANMVRAEATTARVLLLETYGRHPDGLTGPEAADLAGLPPMSNWTGRVSELFGWGFIRDTGKSRASGWQGNPHSVRAITAEGLDVLELRRLGPAE